MASKRIVFITGTRADFGKIKTLIQQASLVDDYEVFVFVTGMHTLAHHGYTIEEVYKSLEGFPVMTAEGQRIHGIYSYINQVRGEAMDQTLANTIQGFSRYITEIEPDLIVAHGDRVEAMAAAIVGALRNILVAHIEGGELSGTVDEIIRHAVTKCSHAHFVANDEAKQRLLQLGEVEESVFVIGSPDIDVMLSDTLPDLQEVLSYYDVPFKDFAIAMLHPVTTNLKETKESADAMVDAMLKSDLNYLVIQPNNDSGSDLIETAYEKLKDNPKIIIRPSMRFEYFLTALKYSRFIIGNSSAGVREAPVYGVPTINVASRQDRRFSHDSILCVKPEANDILELMKKTLDLPPFEPCYHFGGGDSTEKFIHAITENTFWNIPTQKLFVDIPAP